MEGSDEIGIFPQHGVALAAAIETGSVLAVKAETVEDNYEFSVQPGIIGWLRACARRNEMAIEPAGQWGVRASVKHTATEPRLRQIIVTILASMRASSNRRTLCGLFKPFLPARSPPRR
ncbi:hypothetical protein AYJ54_00950 [Bradyrhizobium centrolobii]|uniref:Uncharacterized protein n=1 Tax=Bradyrhizobium centrolobii TaxID=1505087 RepID=A0A176YIL0_9BRAD|nr:hypothetical protein [Bradyrhizobium centrolobii]OAF05506.1 hypothetical protein AYJ54_00950 [Bradyrhizobium centrolobii]